MRQSRLRKYKQRRVVGSLIFVHLLAIYFLSLYGIIHFITPTNAALNDVERLTLSLEYSGEFEMPDDDDDGDDGEEGEWDKSSLEFKEQSSNCREGTIAAIIQNGSDSRAMRGPVAYEVYWIDKGNPKRGTIVAGGQVPALGPGEIYEIVYQPELAGNYMFKAYQRPGHPGIGELWSEAINVNQECISNYRKNIGNINKINNEKSLDDHDESMTQKQDISQQPNPPKPIEDNRAENDKQNEEEAADEEKVRAKEDGHLYENNVEMD